MSAAVAMPPLKTNPNTHSTLSPSSANKGNSTKKWAPVALLAAGIALIVLGVGGSITLGAFGFQGAVSIMEAHLITFNIQHFVGALATLAAGVFGGFGCLLGRASLLREASALSHFAR